MAVGREEPEVWRGRGTEMQQVGQWAAITSTAGCKGHAQESTRAWSLGFSLPALELKGNDGFRLWSKLTGFVDSKASSGLESGRPVCGQMRGWK